MRRGPVSCRLVALVAAALLTTGLTTVLSAGSASAAAASTTVAPITGGGGVTPAAEPERLRPRVGRLPAVRVLPHGRCQLRTPRAAAVDGGRQVDGRRRARHAPYKTRGRRLPADRPEEVQRHRHRRVAQRDRRRRRQPGLDADPQRAHPRRIRLGGCVGAGRGREPAQGATAILHPAVGPGDPVRYATLVASRRQLLLRHLLAGRAGGPRPTRR